MYCVFLGQNAVSRGAKQISYNYNYGQFSTFMYGDPLHLLKNPELLATTWLALASAVWFFVMPQPPKPSMLEVRIWFGLVFLIVKEKRVASVLSRLTD